MTVVADSGEGSLLSVREVAERLEVSRSWVRDHARELYGYQRTEGKREWRFPREAINKGRLMIEDSSYSKTLVYECERCGERVTVSKGKFGSVVRKMHGCLVCEGEMG